MTATTPSQPDPTPRVSPLQRVGLSSTQLLASALAAITATVAASYLGVSGTVIGAAVASVLSVAGNAVYAHSIRQTGSRVRNAVPVAARWAPGGVPGAAPSSAGARRDAGEPARVRHATSLRVLGAACAGVFVAVLALVTSVEIVAGRPLADLVRGDAGTGTTVFGGAVRPQAHGVLAPPTPTVTVTAKVVTVTPTVTVTAPAASSTVPPPSPTTTPTPTPTPSAPTTPDPAPTLP